MQEQSKENLYKYKPYDTVRASIIFLKVASSVQISKKLFSQNSSETFGNSFIKNEIYMVLP